MVVIVLCGLALFWLYESCLFIYLIFTFLRKETQGHVIMQLY